MQITNRLVLRLSAWRRRGGGSGLALAGLLLALLAAGCATTESDMPWNTPQTWEGSPSIPGFGGGGDGY